ncbi:hypothetical protein BWQ96_07810 [Gracilariopsis chorda]|uniref:Uncharacterized protein n=1 Tax=Gracilariopsis chorda TaxID=448386 RepID=A0A2V3IK66_9FLOR|nr:hypothetical protein BWQ96_07810 [Gracilariopsis chorda]|eukprot:PXF42472.1 hypothetical protein BWQ96_07810 [Gracilariopsis chorda]
MSFFDKQAKQALLKQVGKKLEEHKSKLSAKSSASAPTTHDGTENPYVPPYAHQSSSTPHQQYRPPAGYPGSSHQPSSSSGHPQQHTAQDKKNWQDKLSSKLQDPSVQAKAQKAAKSKATKKVTKSLLKGAGQLLAGTFEE